MLALSCHSGGVDSGYSEENFPIRSYKRLLHTRCPYCYCERSLSFNNNRKKLRNNSSTESFPSDIITTKENQNSSYIDCCNREKLLFSQSYPHIKPIPRTNFHSKQQITRTLADKRQRNLSCDASLWTRIQTPKPNNLVRMRLIERKIKNRKFKNEEIIFQSIIYLSMVCFLDVIVRLFQIESSFSSTWFYNN